jgi:hypothetical protein
MLIALTSEGLIQGDARDHHILLKAGGFSDGLYVDPHAIPRTFFSSLASLAEPEDGLCLECGGNSLAAFSEHVDLGLIRPRGQG